jgi:hypothetical protein
LCKTKDQWWLKSYFEFILDQPRIGIINIKKGINRIEVNEPMLKDGDLIPFTIQIYGTELNILIPPNVKAVYVYNVVAAWMGQEPCRIKIQVCKLENQLKEWVIF